MAPLGERVIKFKADFSEFLKDSQANFEKAAQHSDKLRDSVEKVSHWMRNAGVAVGGAAVAFLGFTKGIPALGAITHHVKEMYEGVHKAELGILSAGGALGKTSGELLNTASAAGALSVVFQQLGVGGEFVAQIFTGIRNASLLSLAAIHLLVAGIGKLSEMLGERLTSAAKKGLEAGLEFEKQTFALKTAVEAFGKSADGTSLNVDDLSQRIRKLSATTGLSFSDIKSGMVVMLEMSKVTKITAGEMDKLLESMADFATVRNTDFMTVVLAVDQAMRGLTRRAMSLGLAFDDASVKEHALQMGLIKAGQQMNSTELAGMKIAVMLDMMKFALGKAAEAANTTAFGALKALEGELLVLKGEFGEGVAKGIQPWYAALKNALKSVHEFVGKDMVGIAGQVASFGGTVFTIIGHLLKWASVIIGTSAAIKLLSTSFGLFKTAIAGIKWAELISHTSTIGKMLEFVGISVDNSAFKMVGLTKTITSLTGVKQLLIKVLGFLGSTLTGLVSKLAVWTGAVALAVLPFAALAGVLVHLEQKTNIFGHMFAEVSKALTGSAKTVGDTWTWLKEKGLDLIVILLTPLAAAFLGIAMIVNEATNIFARFGALLARLVGSKEGVEYFHSLQDATDETRKRLNAGAAAIDESFRKSVRNFMGYKDEVVKTKKEIQKEMQDLVSKEIFGHKVTSEELEGWNKHLKVLEALGKNAEAAKVKLDIFKKGLIDLDATAKEIAAAVEIRAKQEEKTRIESIRAPLRTAQDVNRLMELVAESEYARLTALGVARDRATAQALDVARQIRIAQAETQHERVNMLQEAAKQEVDLVQSRLQSEGRVFEVMQFEIKRRQKEIQNEFNTRMVEASKLVSGSIEWETKVTEATRRASIDRKLLTQQEVEARSKMIQDGAVAMERLGIADKANFAKGMKEIEEVFKNVMIARQSLKAVENDRPGLAAQMQQNIREAEIKQLDELLRKYPDLAGYVTAMKEKYAKMGEEGEASADAQSKALAKLEEVSKAIESYQKALIDTSSLMDKSISGTMIKIDLLAQAAEKAGQKVALIQQLFAQGVSTNRIEGGAAAGTFVPEDTANQQLSDAASGPGGLKGLAVTALSGNPWSALMKPLVSAALVETAKLSVGWKKALQEMHQDAADTAPKIAQGMRKGLYESIVDYIKREFIRGGGINDTPAGETPVSGSSTIRG